MPVRIKIAEAPEMVLDYLIATIRDIDCLPPKMNGWRVIPTEIPDGFYAPSTDLGQFAQILVEKGICLNSDVEGYGENWEAHMPGKDSVSGHSAPVAGLRAYVIEQLGEATVVPDDLLRVAQEASNRATPSINHAPDRPRS